MKHILTAAVFLLIGCSSSSDKSVSMDDDGDPVSGQAPTAVSGLQGIAYTDTEIEIFWDSASDTNGVVVGYSVMRNGSELAAALDASSFYDNTVAPGESYSYTVSAMDDSGNTGPRAQVTVAAPEAYLTLNRDNYAAVVRYVLGIYASQPMRASVYQPFDAFLGQVPDTSNFNQSSFLLTSTYTCSNGGTAVAEETSASATGFHRVSFEDCQVGEYLYTGEAEFNRSEGQSTARTFRNYSVKDATGATLRISGQVSQSNYVCRSDNYQSWNTTEFTWESSDFTGATVIDNASTRFGAGTNCGDAWRTNMTGGFSVRSPNTGNKPIQVAVLTDFLSTDPNNTNFQSGVMELMGLDGSSLVFDAANEDPDSVTITLNTPTGTESFAEPWSTWQGILVPRGTGL